MMKSLIAGLKPSSDYRIVLKVEFESNAFKGMIWIGGSPVNFAYFKAGVAGIQSAIESNQKDNYLRNNSGNPFTAKPKVREICGLLSEPILVLKEKQHSTIPI